MVRHRWNLAARILLVAIAFGLIACDKGPAPPPNPDIEFSTPSAKVLVVFLHGVLGNAASTFKADAATQGWPELLARDSSIGKPISTLSLGYSTDPLSRASNIVEIATAVQSKLIDRRLFEQHDKVIIIAHSMGGLVAKRLLHQLSGDHPAAQAKVAGVFFLGVPSGGAELADVAAWISRNPQFGNMKSEDFNTFLQAEEVEWAAFLRRRNSDWPYPRTFCLYEVLPFGPLTVVPRSRSQVGCDDDPRAFDRHHINLVKPVDTRDEVYEYVAARIRRIVMDEYLPLKVTAEMKSPSGLVFADMARLKSGDQYVIEVKANKPAWLYVFNQDSRNRIERYHPAQMTGAQNEPTMFLRIPQDSANALTLDTNRGAERIVVLASNNDRQDLAGVAAEIAAQSSRGPAVLDRELSKRGARVAQARHEVSVDHGAEPPTALPIGTADAAVELRFWHE